VEIETLTLDQGGNVWEWNETKPLAGSRGLRGGSWNSIAVELGKGVLPNNISPLSEGSEFGFRVASAAPPIVPTLAPGAIGLLSALLVAGGAVRLRQRS
jgi:hypothetical protein